MTRNTATVEMYATELEGEIIIGHRGLSPCPQHTFNAVRDAVSDLDAYNDGDLVAVAEWDTDTEEILDVEVVSP